MNETEQRVFVGDCAEMLKKLPNDCIDAVVTDPPYGLSKEPDMREVLQHWMAGDDYKHHATGFMGKSWDSFVPGPAMWREAFRVLKPGGHALVFAGSRTVDLMTTSLRLAGFEIRDIMQWLYFNGYPKSLDVSKALDKAAGVEREVVGEVEMSAHAWNAKGREQIEAGNTKYFVEETKPTSDLAKQWDGWGTALKPAYEPIIVARKPLIGTVAENVARYGTGAININGTRIGGK